MKSLSPEGHRGPARSPSLLLTELLLPPWVLTGQRETWAGVTGSNGFHLVPGSYLSEAAPET